MTKSGRRVSLVTGASRGAGHGIAEALGAAGDVVYVTDRGPGAAKSLPGSIEDTADRVRAAGGIGIAVQCDHAVDEDVAALFRLIRQDHKRLDILVNNAAFLHDDLIAPGGLSRSNLWTSSRSGCAAIM